MVMKLSAFVAAGLVAIGLATPGLAQIKIGYGGPLTGPNAAFGAQIRAGVEQAVEDINRRGGVLGQRLSAHGGDDVSDPRQGVSVANKFVADGIQFVVGHFNSGVSVPVSEIYAENGILMVTPSSTNPLLTERGLWNVARTSGRDDQQGVVAAEWLKRNYAGRRVALLHDKTKYGQGLTDVTRGALKGSRVTEALYEGVNGGEKDFSAVIRRIKASGAALVYWGGLHTEGALIVRQMADQGMRVPLMSGDGITTDEFATIGGPGSEGTLMTFPADPTKRPEAAAVVAALKARSRVTEAYTLYAYAAVEVIAQAAQAANSLDRRKVAAQMRTGMRFQTAIGTLSFDRKGDITRPDYVMYVWKRVDGKITYVQLPDGDGAGAHVAAAPPAVSPPPVVAPPVVLPQPVVPPVAAPGAPLNENRVALVIGNSRYANQPILANPSRDADRLAESLRKIGFRQVVVAKDLTHDGMRRALLDFSELADKADWAMIYFAGHGIEIDQKNYLLPVDARLRSDRAVSFEAVPLEQALDSVRGARKMRIVILDACRENPFRNQLASNSRNITRGLGRPPEPARGTVVVYAAKEGTLADDDGGAGNSPFLSALVRNIETPQVEIDKLFRRVRDDVLEATNRRQEPHVYSSLSSDDFFFNPR